MSKPIIFNDVDFHFRDVGSLSYLKYKGEPFCGTLQINGDSGKGYELIDYHNGVLHGHRLTFYPDGNVLADKRYDQAHCISQKEWYSNGQPKKERYAATEYFWDTDGTLVKDNLRWLYKSGQPLEEQVHNQILYFSLQGELAVKMVHTKSAPNRYCNVFYYYDHVLRKCFEELFTNHYPQLDEQFPRQQLLPDWLNAVYLENQELAKSLLDTLINHPTQQTRETAARLKNNVLNLEIGEKRDGGIHPPHPNHIIVKLNFDTRF